MFCVVYILNNFFQDRNVYSKVDFDVISYSFSLDVFVNFYKNIFGLGNYDVNVLMVVLQLREYEVIWFDKRL